MRHFGAKMRLKKGGKKAGGADPVNIVNVVEFSIF